MKVLINSLKQIREKFEQKNYEDSLTLKDELEKILFSDRVIEIFEDMSKTGVLNEVLPELIPSVNCNQDNLHHKYDVFHHILHSVKSVDIQEISLEQQKILKWTMLLHDIAKPLTKKKRFAKAIGKEQDTFYGHAEKSAELVPIILCRFSIDEDDIKKIQKLVRYHDELINYKLTNDERILTNRSFIPINKETVSELIKKIGENDFKLLMRVIKADRDAQSDYQKENKENIQKAVIEYAQIIMNDKKINKEDLHESKN